MAKKKAAKAAAKVEGPALEQAAAMGQIPPPPPGAFDGIPGTIPHAPVMIRRNGRLVPAEELPGYAGPRMPQGPAHSVAGHAPLPAGYPLGQDAGHQSTFGHYDTGAPRRAFNSTFHEPSQEVQAARQTASSLRMTLGQTINQMELAYHEALRVLKAAKTSATLRTECEREGIDLDQVKAFADEVDDVLRIFVPVEEGEG